jgi:hypothetical protein
MGGVQLYDAQTKFNKDVVIVSKVFTGGVKYIRIRIRKQKLKCIFRYE